MVQRTVNGKSDKTQIDLMMIVAREVAAAMAGGILKKAVRMPT
jgi:hypothetical protein